MTVLTVLMKHTISGGVGFDINCGVRVLRTNLHERDLTSGGKEQLAQALFDAIPVGVGSEGVVKISYNDLDEILVRLPQKGSTGQPHNDGPLTARKEIWKLISFWLFRTLE